VRDLLDHVDRSLAAGMSIAVARVVGVAGSAPRGPGAALMVNDEGEVFGSVSGGCVEGAVVTACTEVLAGAPPKLVTYGIADELAATVGLTCGGTIHVFVEPLDWGSVYDELAAALRADEPATLVTVVDGPVPGTHAVVRSDRATSRRSLGDPRLEAAVQRDAAGQLDTALTGMRHYGPQGEARQDDVAVFLEPFTPAPRMIIFGAVDFTTALSRIAKVLGYHVTVCDARPVFATPRRFPDAEVVVDWPDRYLRAGQNQGPGPRDAICVLTHDPKFDVPAIVAALETDAGYIGVMGSRRTTEQRNARLREAGLDDADFDRIMAPIGLDLGATTPEETAISICAEIIRLRSGSSGVSLREMRHAIHATER
jgi:xanthine dehydrogenase accessory factor